MLVRSALAALDFNFNINRKVKKSADGQPMYKMKVSAILSLLKYINYMISVILCCLVPVLVIEAT